MAEQNQDAARVEDTSPSSAAFPEPTGGASVAATAREQAGSGGAGPSAADGGTPTFADRLAAMEANAEAILAQTKAFEDSRRTGATTQHTDETQAMLDANARMARAEAIAQGGHEPFSISHAVVSPIESAESPPGASPPRGFFQQAATYWVGMFDPVASESGLVKTSYTLDASAITADANGDKLVAEGTVLQASGTKVAPRTGANAAVGVLYRRVNVRYGDADITMIIGGRLRSDKLTDNGVYGSVAAGAVTQLAAMGIYLTTYDV